MRVLTSTEPFGDPRGSVVTIGVFDGVHRGHQSLLDHVVRDAAASGCAATVVTFDPHPARALAPERAPLALESLERRLTRLASRGVEQTRVITFDAAAAHESAESFVRRVLVDELAARHIVVGEDFRFGHNRTGDVAALHAWGDELNFVAEGVPLVGDGPRFSSTAARAYVAAGDLPGAEHILGHRVVVSGVVRHGDARGGSELGYPTANLYLPATMVHPGMGIYAGAARTAEGQWYAAAISVGRRPQFYVDGELLFEAHLVNFDGDLYDTALDVVLLQFLRTEAKFSSVDELVRQIGRDVAATVAVYDSHAAEPESLLGFSLGQRR